MVLGIPRYLVFEDWDDQADLPSGEIPGWYWVSRDTKYSRIRVLRRICHLGTSQDGTGYPGKLSILGLGYSGGHAVWGIPG